MTHHVFVVRCAAGNVVLKREGFHTRALEQDGNIVRKKRKERESETE